MVEIRQYTRQRLPQQLVQGRRATASDFGGDQTGMLALAEGYGQMSNALGKLSDTVTEIKERRETSDYIRKVSEFQLTNVSRLKELQEQEYDDGIDFAATWSQDLQERAQAFMGDIPNHLQDRWAQDLSSMSLGFAKAGMQDQIKREGFKQELNYNNTIDSWNQIVKSDPSRIGEANAAIESMVGTFKMSPEEKALFIDKAQDEFSSTRSSAIKAARTDRIENDPFSVINNPEGYTKDELKMAYDMADKFQERIEKRNRVNGFVEEQDAYNRLIGLDPNQPRLTLAEVEQMAATKGETEFVKYARETLTKAIKDAPLPPVAEQVNIFDELNRELSVLKAEIGKSPKLKLDTYDNYQKFREKVFKYVRSKHIEEGEAQTFLGEYSKLIDQAISTDSTEAYGNTWARGVQDPLGVGFEKIDSLLKKSNLSDYNKNVAKRRLFKIFEQNLGDYESKGNHSTDMELIDKAWENTLKEYNGKENPNLPPNTNAVVTTVQPVTNEDIDNMSEEELDAFLGIE